MKSLSKLVQEVKEIDGKVDQRNTCARVGAAVENYLIREDATKVNHLPHCKGEQDCKCSSGHKSGLVDLIVLIDTSTSMAGAASKLSEASTDAIELARKNCPSDLRIVFMGVERIWPNTVFQTNHLAYLQSLHPGVTFAGQLPIVGYQLEQGANAIEDLSRYYDWRPDACRAIFYLSDEELDGSTPLGDTTNEDNVTRAAITAANANQVTVFADFLQNHSRGASIYQNYRDLCAQTGGEYYQTGTPSKDEFVAILSEVICKSCGGCKVVPKPDLKPCISISWGDSDCDCAETDDFEVMHITVCNCYSNVTFSNFSIGYIYVTDENGQNVASLPSGSPSVQALPIGPYCFGDIGPCANDKPSCKSRQFVLSTRGAKPGKYRVVLGAVCYDVAFHYDSSACFELTLCKS
jgi:hypothetical protein